MALSALGSPAPIFGIFLATSLTISLCAADPPQPREIPAKDATVTLSAKEYKELLDRIEKLQELVDAKPLARPRVCEMEGRVELRGKQSVVRIKASFKFTTTRAGAIIHLGCQRAQAVEAKLDDGKTPLISAGDDGLRVQVETPGDHTIRLELDVPITARGAKGSELGFDMGLPGCPITTLSFESPAGVRRYTLSTRQPKPAGVGPAVAESDIEQPEAERLTPGKGGMPLGAVTFVALSWEDPGRKLDAARSASADITVTLGASEVVTESKFRLRGQAVEWKFTAPVTADVTVGLWSSPGTVKPPELTADRAPNVIRPDSGSTIWRLVFRESVQIDLQVTVTLRQDRPRATDVPGKNAYPVGPFAVLGVPQQTGVIRVRTPPNWKATANLKGDTKRDTDEVAGEMSFRYRLNELSVAPAAAPLELTFAAVPGIVQARARHELRLTESSWQLRSEIAISPTQAEVEYIDLEVPTAFRISLAEPKEVVEELSLLREMSPERRVYRARLSSPKRTSFSFTLEGDYPQRPTEMSVSIPLPRLLGVNERSTEILVLSPLRYEVRGTVRSWEGAKPGTWETPLEAEPSEVGFRLKGAAEKPIATAELTWKLAPINASIRSEADVDIEETTLRVSQKLVLRSTGKLPNRIRLKTDRMPSNLRVNRGSLETIGVGYDLVLPEDAASSEILLQYTIPIPQTEGPTILPLLLPEGVDGPFVTRVWLSDLRTANIVEPSEWTRQPVEVSADRPMLPALVLRGQSPKTLPRIAFGARPMTGEGGSQIERGAIEVRLSEDETAYRANYWLRQGEQPAEFTLPAEAKGIEVYVQGKRLSLPPHAVSDATVVRVPRLKAGNGLVRVEFRYRCSPGKLVPPLPVPPTQTGEVIWTIASSPGWVSLMSGDARGCWSPSALFALLGAGPVPFIRGETRNASGENEGGAVIRQSEPGPFEVYQVPRNLWLLGWSIGVFVLFGIFSLVGKYWAMTVALLGSLLVLIGSFVIAQPVAQALFAASPGLLAYFLLFLILRWAKSRYRRRVDRSIGFARSGTMLIRPRAARLPEPISRKSASGSVSSPSPS